MMEESCPTTQGYREINICCVCTSLCRLDDTLTQMGKKKKRNILDLCVLLIVIFDHPAESCLLVNTG